MKIRLKLRRSPPAFSPLTLFSTAPPEHAAPLLPACGSLAAHAALVGGLVLFHAAGWQEVREKPVTYSLTMLRLKVDQPIFLPLPPTSTSHVAGHDSAPPSAQPAGASAKRQRSAAPPAEARGQRVQQMEFPRVTEFSPDLPLIRQPAPTPQKHPVKKPLPQLAFWEQPPTATPPPKEFVAPSKTVKEAAIIALDAPPQVAAPISESNAGALNLPIQPANPNPALPVANSASAPVRIRDGSKRVETPSFEAQQGTPVDILILSKENNPVTKVEVPRALENIPPVEGIGKVAALASAGINPAPKNQPTGTGENTTKPGPPSASSVTRDGSGAANSISHTSSSAPSTAPAANAAVPDGHGNGGSGSGSNPSAAGGKPAGEVGAPAVAAAPSAVNGAREKAEAAVTRITHPANGNFDVILMHSALSDDLLDLGAVLSGNPIYTVYLPVGDTKEWLLEYCLPNRQSAQSNTYEINVDDVPPLTAPYPITTVIPKNIIGQSHTRHIVLHARLTASGVLADVKAGEDSNPMIQQLLPWLNQWQFRPAAKDRVPVDVEVLLVIPPRQ